MKVTARSLENYQVEINSGEHRLVSDEPKDVGDDAGPDPYGLLLAALAACKVITLRMYAEHKGWSLEAVQVALDIDRIHARDCEDCESDPNAKVDIIRAQLSVQGELTQDQIDRLVEISERCPVHRTLTSETKIRTQLVSTLSA